MFCRSCYSSTAFIVGRTRCSGTTEIGLLCNPNAYPTAFQAKVLVKMSERSSGIELTTEVPLSKFKQDLDDFLKTAAAAE